MKRAWIFGIALLATACSGADVTGGEEGEIRDAAQAYSDAYLTGASDAAYRLLSKRCQERMGDAAFRELVTTAAGMYGDPLKFTSFRADVNDDQARVTYTYSDATINQTDEPWVNEDGEWREDDC